MSQNNEKSLIKALKDFFTDCNDDDNDLMTQFQPDYNFFLVENLVYLLDDPELQAKIGQVTKDGYDFIVNNLNLIEDNYDYEFTSCTIEVMELPNFNPIPQAYLEKFVQVDNGIRFLMSKDFLENNNEMAHGHDWPKGSLICEECTDSPSYIGIDNYDYCEKASLVVLRAINLNPIWLEDVSNAEIIVSAAVAANSD